MTYYVKPDSESHLILRDTVETLKVTFYSGETATAADGSVTLGIVDEAGNTIVSSGTAATAVGSGVYSYTLPAQSDLKLLTVTWNGTWSSNSQTFLTQHEVIGGFYTTPAEVRSMDSISGETSAFPLADLVSAIQWATQVIDDFCGTSFVYRYHRDILTGTDDQNIKLKEMFPRTIISATIDGTALTTAEKNKIPLFDSGVIIREDSVWDYTEAGQKVIIEYEAGVTKQPPADIAWACRTLARYHLIEQLSRIPERALSISSEFGNIQLAQPSMDRPTPLPDVNVILQRHRHRAPIAY